MFRSTPKSTRRSTNVLILSVLFFTCATSADDSIKALMQDTITPATNIIWGAPDTPDDKDWLLLEKAAANLEKAALTMKTSPVELAKQEEWQKFNNDFIDASALVSKAIENRDRSTLFNVGNDKLYPPCEDCHQQYLQRD